MNTERRAYGIVDKIALDAAIAAGDIVPGLLFGVATESGEYAMNVKIDGTLCVLKADDKIPVQQLGGLTRAEYLKLRAAQLGIGYIEYTHAEVRAIIATDEWRGVPEDE